MEEEGAHETLTQLVAQVIIAIAMLEEETGAGQVAPRGVEIKLVSFWIWRNNA